MLQFKEELTCFEWLRDWSQIKKFFKVRFCHLYKGFFKIGQFIWCFFFHLLVVCRWTINKSATFENNFRFFFFKNNAKTYPPCNEKQDFKLEQPHVVLFTAVTFHHASPSIRWAPRGFVFLISVTQGMIGSTWACQKSKHVQTVIERVEWEWWEICQAFFVCFY